MRHKKLCFAIFICFTIYNIFHLIKKSESPKNRANKTAPPPVLYNMQTVARARILFIGGFGLRNSSLVTRILEQERPGVECKRGADFDFMADFLKFTNDMRFQANRMREIILAGLTETKLDNAARLHVHSLVSADSAANSSLDQIYCVDNAECLNHMAYLKRLFPMAKFVLVNRDLKSILNEIKLKSEADFDAFMERKRQSELFREFKRRVDRQCGLVGNSSCLSARVDVDREVLLDRVRDLLLNF
jgi:hypothetical protein